MLPSWPPIPVDDCVPFRPADITRAHDVPQRLLPEAACQKAVPSRSAATFKNNPVQMSDTANIPYQNRGSENYLADHQPLALHEIDRPQSLGWFSTTGLKDRANARCSLGNGLLPWAHEAFLNRRYCWRRR